MQHQNVGEEVMKEALRKRRLLALLSLSELLLHLSQRRQHQVDRGMLVGLERRARRAHHLHLRQQGLRALGVHSRPGIILGQQSVRLLDDDVVDVLLQLQHALKQILEPPPAHATRNLGSERNQHTLFFLGQQ